MVRCLPAFSLYNSNLWRQIYSNIGLGENVGDPLRCLARSRPARTYLHHTSKLACGKRKHVHNAWMHVRIRECRHQAGPYQSQWGCTRNRWPLVLISGAYSWRITRYACIMEVWGSSQDFVRARRLQAAGARRVLLLCSLESPLHLVVGWLPHISFLILGLHFLVFIVTSWRYSVIAWCGVGDDVRGHAVTILSVLW